jgi:hypothetical protein
MIEAAEREVVNRRPNFTPRRADAFRRCLCRVRPVCRGHRRRRSQPRAVANEAGRVEAVIDCKSGVNPTVVDIEMYRGQVRDYLTATGAGLGLIVFLTSGRIERVQLADYRWV